MTGPVEPTEPNLLAGERIDVIHSGRLRLIQSARGNRFSIDALLLAASAEVTSGARVLDLGCGNGVIAIALASLYEPASVNGLELQEGLADQAERNIVLNGFEDSVSIIRGDVRSARTLLNSSSYDQVVMNPPYFPKRDGRVNPNSERAVARHEVMGTLSDFVAAARYGLVNKGSVLVIYPAFRSPQLLAELAQQGLSPTKVRYVHPRPAEDANLVLVEARKDGGPQLRILPPWNVREGEEYSDVVERIIAGERLQ